MEKEANTLRNYFRTDCPLTFHNITEVHPSSLGQRLALAANIQEVAAPHALLAGCIPPARAHSRGLAIASPEGQFSGGVGSGWVGEWWGEVQHFASQFFRRVQETAARIVLILWVLFRAYKSFAFWMDLKRFLSLSLSWNLLAYVVSFYKDHMGTFTHCLVCFLREEELQLPESSWDPIFNHLYLSL